MVMGLFAENKTIYEEERLIGLAKRQNNARRPFLIVNKMQGKHIPADPRETLAYFGQLGRAAAEMCADGENVLVIGFAETATAVGAAVAAEIPGSVYCHTTREDMNGRVPAVEFLEEHSHAAGHALYAGGLERFDRIIFVDDEITTGKTIANFIRALEKSKLIREDVKFTVAALIFNAQAKNLLGGGRVLLAYLARIDAADITAPDIFPIPDGTADLCGSDGAEARRISVYGLLNPRAGAASADYREGCRRFAEEAAGRLGINEGDVLVLGSEEFMYPALRLGAELRARGVNALCHATTRSPIEPSGAENYPIKSRWPLSSLYDAGRRTYLYNLRRYDAVVIATDAPRNDGAERRITETLGYLGNTDIHIVRWTA